jgi:two-component system OmpR family response regulator
MHLTWEKTMTGNIADQMVETFEGIDRIDSIAFDGPDGIADALRHCGGAELDALIEALARRAADIPVTKLRAGLLELDLIERTAKRNDRAIDLLPREFRLLEYMMRHKGRVLTREMLFREVWKYKFDPKTNLVDVHMGRLRRKIDWPHEQPLILNIRGSGFVLRVENGH